MKETMERETARDIDAHAALWVARIDNAPLDSAREQELEAWLEGDSRRRGAFMRLRAIAIHSDRAQALGQGYDPDSFAAPEAEVSQEGSNAVLEEDSNQARNIYANDDSYEQLDATVGRRKFMWLGGSAVAASVAGAVGFGLFSGVKSYETAVGEMRVIKLSDGTVVTLNTNSAFTERFAEKQRLVILEEGEALFDVAKDASRPFIVQAGGTSVRAVGTSFTVKKLATAPVEILVREGVVEVTQRKAVRAIRMVANTRMVATEAAVKLQPVSVAPEELSREIAWKSGQIAFEGETLENAARQFQRYSPTHIIIDDPDVAREEITGLFEANDPVSFAQAAAASLELRATVAAGEVRITR